MIVAAPFYMCVRHVQHYVVKDHCTLGSRKR